MFFSNWREQHPPREVGGIVTLEAQWQAIVDTQRELNQQLGALLKAVEINLFDEELVRQFKEEITELLVQTQRQGNHICRQYLESIDH